MFETVVKHWLPLTALAAGGLLYALVPWLTNSGRSREEAQGQAVLLRLVLGAFVVLQVADVLLHEALDSYYNRLLLRSSLSILAVLVVLVVLNASTRVFDAKFGERRRIDGEEVAVASYHSRMASGLFLFLLLALMTYVLIEVWGLESLLERTGFIGIIAAFFVLTSSAWLPDLFYGLVLLNSSMTEEGDTIRLPEQDDIYIVNRLTPFYAILLDVDNGPDGLTRATNGWLYEKVGLKAAFQTLNPGGILGVWSAFEDPKFTKRLKSCGFEVEVLPVRANGKKGARHTIWYAKRPVAR